MSILINPCDATSGVENTGFECAKSLSVPKGVILVPANASWSKTDMADPHAFFMGKIQAVRGTRFFPIFADLKDFAVTNVSDVTETFQDGTTKMIRLGGYTLAFTFADGGECLAKSLLSFNKKGYRMIVVDELGQFKVRANSDGTYSGLKVSDLYAAQPVNATFAISYKNVINANISVEEYIENSEIFKSDADLTELLGLLNVDVASLGAPTITKVTVGATTECAGSNLYDTYADALAVIGAWKITDSTGMPVTISAATKNTTVNGWDLTFATQAGKTLTVGLADTATLYALTSPVVGYEGIQSATIVIPAT